MARNTGTVDYAGFEGSLLMKLGTVRPFANVAYVHDLGTSTGNVTAYPNVLASAGADVDVPTAKLHFVGRVRYVGERMATEPNVLYNLSQAYSLPRTRWWT